MKIIFDSEEQKEAFIHRICPSYLGFDDDRYCGGMCKKCWENAIEIEIKEEKKPNPVSSCVSFRLRQLYKVLKMYLECENCKIIYKENMMEIICEEEFYELKNAGLIKCCGILNGREIYELCGE